MNEKPDLEKAIKLLEKNRKKLGDSVTDIAIAAIQEKDNELSKNSRRPEQQRKLVSILFMDIVSSTKLIQDLDPEESLSIMDDVLQKLAKPISLYGGKVTRFMGDGFLAIFGLPIAQENDPERAVKAGLEIQNITHNIAKQLEKTWDIDKFLVRIGVNTGLIVAGGQTEAENTFAGSAINLAARLESSAPPGGFLISEYTYQHVRGLFEVEKVQKIKAKGFMEPVQVYLVKKTVQSSFRLVNRGIEGIQTKLVGRETEFQQLKDSYQTLIQSNKFRIVTVIGDAGLGKSRLLFEFEKWVQEQKAKIIILRGRAVLETEHNPYSLFKNLFALNFNILETDSIALVRNKLIKGLKSSQKDIKDVEARAVFIGQLLGYNFREQKRIKEMEENPKQLKDLAVLYLKEFLTTLVSNQPILIFLDDIHWADNSSLDLILELKRELKSCKFLIVALARPTLLERRTTWNIDVADEIINLQTFTEEGNKQFVKEILIKIKNIPNRLIDLIVSRAEGNPYYTEEIIRILIEDQIIIEEEDQGRVVVDKLTNFRIPATLTGILQARLEKLPAVSKTLIQQASVVGRIFWDDILKVINSSEIKIQNLDIKKELNSLQERGLIIKRESSTFENFEEFEFKQRIIKDVAYEGVLLKERQTYHEIVAKWIIKSSNERLMEFSGLIAGHFEQAGLREKALTYMMQAAEASYANYAVEEAYQYYNRALDLTLENDYETRFKLMIGKDTLYNLKGDRENQRENIKSLKKIARTLKDDEKLASVYNREGWFMFWTSDYKKMFTVANKARKLSEHFSNQKIEHDSLQILAWSLLQQGKVKRAEKYANKSLALVREMDFPQGEGLTLNLLGLIKMAQGDYFTANSYLHSYLSITRFIGNKYNEMTARNNLGVALTSAGDFSQAEENYEQLIQLSKELGDRVQLGTAYINYAWVKASQEQWKEAIEKAQMGIKLKRGYKHLEGIAEGLMWLAHGYFGLNKLEEAKQAYNEALDLRIKLKQQAFIMGARAGLIRYGLATNDSSLVKKHTEKIMDFLAKGGSLGEAWEPFRIYLSCYQGLKYLKDQRAKSLIQKAYKLLQEIATKIPVDEEQRIFLNDIPWHKELINLWKEEI